MSTVELRRRTKKQIEQLSSQQLKLIADVISYVRDRESEEATQELLDIPGFLESFKRGKRDIRAGRVIDWRKVRDDVKPCSVERGPKDLCLRG